MRLLLLIPVLVLFLSNVPFIHEMPVETKMPMTEDEESCMMNMAGKEMSCQPGAETSNAEEACQLPESNTGDCCKNRCETTTTCVCVFTFAAPAQEIKTFQLHAFNHLSRHTGYLQIKWKDPHIASPGQPPDFI